MSNIDTEGFVTWEPTYISVKVEKDVADLRKAHITVDLVTVDKSADGIIDHGALVREIAIAVGERTSRVIPAKGGAEC